MKHLLMPILSAALLALAAGPVSAQSAAGSKPEIVVKKPAVKASAKAEEETKKPATRASAAKAEDTAKKPPKKAAAKATPVPPKKVAAKKPEPAPVPVKPREPLPFMFGMFDAQKPEPAVLSEDQVAHDEKLALNSKKRPFKVEDRFKPQKVAFSGYRPGTIVINTDEKFLYFIESPVSAIRYGIAVGREGLEFKGKVKVGAKQVWPRWIPTKAMIERDPRQYARYADGMDGGTDNPLGARAIYLYIGKNDTYLRIHGTNQPKTIGSASSNGCFRMINEHVIDLYDRVQMGADVVVL